MSAAAEARLRRILDICGQITDGEGSMEDLWEFTGDPKAQQLIELLLSARAFPNLAEMSSDEFRLESLREEARRLEMNLERGYLN